MTRHTLPPNEWPALDRELWERARQKADFLGEDGPAANWKEVTQITRIKSYGVFLQYLATNNLLDENRLPADRATEDYIKGYYQHLDARKNKPVTVHNRLRELLAMLNALQPGYELRYLAGLVRRTKRRAKPSRIKQGKLIHPGEILAKTYHFLDQEMAGFHANNRRELTLYRDALTIAVLTTVPIRLKNLANLRLDHSFNQNGGQFEISLPETETKTNRPYSGALPIELTPYIDFYLERVRPRLLGTKKAQHLWISYRHRPVNPHTLREDIKKLTRQLFGIAITPHLFRDIVATYLAIHEPHHVRSASANLGHAKLQTTEKHYNQAHMLQAVRSFQDALKQSGTLSAHTGHSE